MTELVWIVLLVPLAWSGVAAGLRRLAGHPVPDDRSEKYQLLIMVTPVLLGVLWIALSRLMPAAMPLPLPSFDDGGPIVAGFHTVATPHVKTAIDLTRWIMDGLPVAWIAGVSVRFAPLAAAFLRLRHIARRAGRAEIEGMTVRLTDAPVPPLAFGRAIILLPADLIARLAPDELRLIVRHEQAHLRRKDPLYFAVLSVLDAVLWFNPFLRGQTRRCRLAAELACDAAASGNNPVEREAYARVLIRTLKHTAGSVLSHAPAAISNVKSGDYRMRLNEIMHADPAARKPKRRWLYLGLAAALAPVAAVQFALAQGTPPSAPLITPAANLQHVTAAVMQMPVAGNISNLYGRRKDPKTGLSAFHRGVDIVAPVGTLVVAPADGKVGATYSNKWDGMALEISYGGHLSTRMTHLNGVKVKWGDHVKAGQAVATVGDTGKSGGPHLHFEVLRNGKLIDPASVLPKAG